MKKAGITNPVRMDDSASLVIECTTIIETNDIALVRSIHDTLLFSNNVIMPQPLP